MEIITKSHIDEAHAAGPYFPQAESADGVCAWHSISPGYVTVNGQQVYLQYPGDCPADLLTKAREFANAVFDLKEARRRAAENAEIDAIISSKTSRGSTPCPKCGTYCYGDCEAN